MSPGPGSERVTHPCGARLSTFQESWLTLETSFCCSLESKDPEPRVQAWKEKEWGRGHHSGPSSHPESSQDWSILLYCP